jgi:hypothetical protein
MMATMAKKVPKFDDLPRLVQWQESRSEQKEQRASKL